MTRMIAALGQVMDWAISRSATVNMTNLRQQVTLGLVVGTGAVYLALSVKWAVLPETRGEWVPDLEWLAFLAVMSGLDSAQYLAKRATYSPDKEAAAKRQSGAQETPAS